MAFPKYAVEDVAAFSGRDVAEYPAPFTDMAIMQATILFQWASALTGMFGDELRDSTIKFGILAMADHLILQQPYQGALASPFNSESMGSYHYMKTYQRASTAATAVSRGEQTGILWFDLAVQQLGVYDSLQGIARGGGTEIFEHDGIFYPGYMQDNTRLLSPAIMDTFQADLAAEFPVTNPAQQEPVIFGGSPAGNLFLDPANDSGEFLPPDSSGY